jgi:hypothetical protein
MLPPVTAPGTKLYRPILVRERADIIVYSIMFWEELIVKALLIIYVASQSSYVVNPNTGGQGVSKVCFVLSFPINSIHSPVFGH